MHSTEGRRGVTDIPLLLSIQEWDREKARHTQKENLQLIRDFWEERETRSGSGQSNNLQNCLFVFVFWLC